MDEENVIFFDGVCNLRNGFIRFVAERDDGKYSFAPLKSDKADDLEIPESVDSIVLVENGNRFTHSDAVIRIMSDLDFPSNLLGKILGSLPRILRNTAYRGVAKSRYSVFGRRDVCMVPDEELKQRFLD